MQRIEIDITDVVEESADGLEEILVGFVSALRFFEGVKVTVQDDADIVSGRALGKNEQP